MDLTALKSLTLLYAEDDALIRQNAIEYLSRYCDHLYEAGDGEEALQKYREETPDIIITDIQMPKLNGLDFASRVRQHDKKTPIIITTAYTDTSYLLQAVELQLIKYIVKPITAEKMQEALHLALESLSDDYETLVALDNHTRYDTLNKTLFIHDTSIKLTHNELLFFDFLVKHRQRTITYEEIEHLIWAYEGMSMDALRSLVRGLRRKLEGDFIENLSGVGYRLRV